MISYFNPRKFLICFTVFAVILLLICGCVPFKKETKSSVPLPGKTDDAPILPAENAAAILIQEGWEIMGKGHLLLAEQKFENALRISPTSGEGYLGLASVAHLQQDYGRALEFLQIGEAYSNQYPDLLSRIYLLKGDCYQALGRGKEAQEVYRKALEIDPENQALIERLKNMH